MSSVEATVGRQAQKTRQTRENIISAVISLINEGGFGEASSGNIAKRAGVTWGAAQHHFGSKEDILEAVINRSHEEFGDKVSITQLRQGTMADRVELFVDQMWLHYQSDVYMAALEILMASRGSGAPRFSEFKESVASSHLLSLQQVFFDSTLSDEGLIEALVYVHCLLTGLSIEGVFENEITRVDRHLRRVKLTLLTMVSDI